MPSKAMKGRLTPKLRRFCELIVIDYMTPSAAYSKCGYKSRRTEQAAWVLLKLPYIQDYINELRERQGMFICKSELLEVLQSIYRDKNAKPNERIAAIMQLSKMAGYDAPQEIKGGGNVMLIKYVKDDNKHANKVFKSVQDAQMIEGNTPYNQQLMINSNEDVNEYIEEDTEDVDINPLTKLNNEESLLNNENNEDVGNSSNVDNVDNVDNAPNNDTTIESNESNGENNG